jgi:tRNA(Ile)-lysidine synthase
VERAAAHATTRATGRRNEPRNRDRSTISLYSTGLTECQTRFVFRAGQMPDQLEEKVAEFIRRHGLFAGAGGILLAVSGGADSIALLHILVALRTQGWIEPDLVCAHINHQLRGPASDADEQFVIEQASQLGVPVVSRAVDVRGCARTHGLSIETAARQLRLTNLGEIAQSRQCTWVCTGHQRNDNAETVLHRLWRGTGLRGLAGIRPVRWVGNLRLASPLLCVTRQEIVQYLQRRQRRWREDQTNADIAYTRNYIRHRLLPLLQQEAQGCLVEELSELAASALKLRDRVEREAEEAWSKFVEPGDGKVMIHALGMASLPEPVAVELIRKALQSMAAGESDMAQAHYRGILQLARRNVGGKEVSLPNGLFARREGEQVILSPERPACRVGLAPPNSDSTTLPTPGTIRCAGHEIEARVLQRNEMDTTGIGGDKSRFVEYLDLDRVSQPVVVRTRRPGDRFQPLGMTAEKKIGKFLTTAKTPHDLREQILIFADREKIVWVCPIRISEQAKVTQCTQHILQLIVR